VLRRGSSGARSPRFPGSAPLGQVPLLAGPSGLAPRAPSWASGIQLQCVMSHSTPPDWIPGYLFSTASGSLATSCGHGVVPSAFDPEQSKECDRTQRHQTASPAPLRLHGSIWLSVHCTRFRIALPALSYFKTTSYVGRSRGGGGSAQTGVCLLRAWHHRCRGTSKALCAVWLLFVSVGR
jgi:hypothetical protein